MADLIVAPDPAPPGKPRFFKGMGRQENSEEVGSQASPHRPKQVRCPDLDWFPHCA